jgi:hypothetical protein
MHSLILITFSRNISSPKKGLIAPFLCTVMLLFSGTPLFSQTLPVDDVKEEQIRLQQLMHGSVYTSFTNRPVWGHTYDSYMNLGDASYGFWSRRHGSPEFELGNSFRAGAYEPSLQITTNSHVPYGENNEAAWYGRGLNGELKAGIWLTSDYLTITFRPQLVSQDNMEFEEPRFIPEDEQGNRLFAAEGIGNIIDRPFRFGEHSFNTISLGYTSIRAHYRMIEAGVSNEPVWWGGNVKYPLLMSNNAPGMKHFFLGTRKPLRIPYLGKLEFKWMGAFPEDSGYFEYREDEEERDRFMNGVNISFSPAIAPNLHFGLARVVHTYLDPVHGLTGEDLGMIFDPMLLTNFVETRGPLANIKPRNHLNSIYARWIWPESRFEIFGEFYREDFAYDSRDLLMEPRHNSGYAFGMQKLLDAPLADFYKLHLEFTNMTPSYLREVRLQNYYYTHPEIRQGHTHRGQVLGAAIGPGSNSQYLGIDGYFQDGRMGLFIRRLVDNNHFHFEYDRALNRPEEFRGGYGDYWRNRVDLTIGTRALYNYREFLISGELSWTKLFNYGRFDYGQFGGLTIANFEPYDITNIQFQFSVTYLF